VNRRLMVGDLAKISQFAPNVDAIVGLDILSRCRAWEIDYAARELNFLEPQTASAEGRPFNAFFVPGILEGRSIRLLVDTGMQGLVLFESRLRSHVGRWKNSERVSAWMGSSKMEQVRLSSLFLGPLQVTAPVFIVPANRNPGPEFMDGVVGPLALNATRVTLDFDGKSLRVRQ
jgi:hypothetical protein